MKDISSLFLNGFQATHPPNLLNYRTKSKKVMTIYFSTRKKIAVNVHLNPSIVKIRLRCNSIMEKFPKKQLPFWRNIEGSLIFVKIRRHSIEAQEKSSGRFDSKFTPLMISPVEEIVMTRTPFIQFGGHHQSRN